MDTLGLRIGGFGYSTDVVNLPEESLAALEGLDTWVVGCFQLRPHHAHANLDRVLEWVGRLKRATDGADPYGHSDGLPRLLRDLPPGIEPGFDGMVLEVPLG